MTPAEKNAPLKTEVDLSKYFFNKKTKQKEPVCCRKFLENVKCPLYTAFQTCVYPHVNKKKFDEAVKQLNKKQ